MTDAKPVVELRREAKDRLFAAVHSMGAIKPYQETAEAIDALADRAEAAEADRCNHDWEECCSKIKQHLSDQLEAAERERDEAQREVKRLTDAFAGSFNLLPGEK